MSPIPLVVSVIIISFIPVGAVKHDIGECSRGEPPEVAARSGAAMLQKRTASAPAVAKEMPVWAKNLPGRANKAHARAQKKRTGSASKKRTKTVQPPLNGLGGSVHPDELHGHDDCRCVGIDGIQGYTNATLKDRTIVSYPADLGARCQAWDLHSHPACPGHDWCEYKWCYVDPCKCKTSVPPRQSNLIPGGMYHNRALYFSYETCGEANDDMSNNPEEITKEIENTCKMRSAIWWGDKKCPCIGLGPQDGITMVSINGSKVAFPGDTGSDCETWEMNVHPACKGTSKPDWCSTAWCYVDPCHCTLPTAPKRSSWLPNANFQGKPIFYSYATCGGVDTYTEDEPMDACANYGKPEDCNAKKKCLFVEGECMNKDLVGICLADLRRRSSAISLGTFVALSLPILGLYRIDH